MRKYDGSKTYVVAHTDGIRGCSWEPWTLRGANPLDFSANHIWIPWPNPLGRDPFSIKAATDYDVTNSPFWPESPRSHVIDFNVETTALETPLSTANDWIEWTSDGSPSQNIALFKNVGGVLVKKDLYLKVKSNVTGASAPSESPGTGQWYYNYLFIRDTLGNRIFVVFSSNWWYGTNLQDRIVGGQRWTDIAIPDAAAGNPLAYCNGLTPISLDSLSADIVSIALETGYDNDIQAQWQCDFINFA